MLPKNPEYYFMLSHVAVCLNQVRHTSLKKKKRQVYSIFVVIRKITIPVKIRKLIGVTMPK